MAMAIAAFEDLQRTAIASHDPMLDHDPSHSLLVILAPRRSHVNLSALITTSSRLAEPRSHPSRERFRVTRVPLLPLRPCCFGRPPVAPDMESSRAAEAFPENPRDATSR
jgi:hypothetical protein